MSSTSPTRSGTARLVSALAASFDVAETEALGRSVALDLRYRATAQGLFLSGVPADLVALVHSTFGRTDDQLVDLSVLAEQWSSADTGVGVGTGPVRLDAVDRDESSTTVSSFGVVGGGAIPKLDEIAGLRVRLRDAGARVAAGLEQPPEWQQVVNVAADHREALEIVLDDVAASRTLTGRFLLDAADYFDDERLDQLGDGYVRAGHGWHQLAVDLATDDGDAVIELERSCCDWMRSAAEPPTRYAF